MRRLLRHLAAWAAAPHHTAPLQNAPVPLFPMIDGGALAYPDLATSLATLALCYPRTTDV